MRSGFLLLALFATVPAAAYVRTTTSSSNPPCPGSNAKPLYWRAVTIPYVVDGAGSDDLTGEAQFDAIHRSFATWQDVPCSYIAFRFDGKKQPAPVGFQQGGSNVNAVTWVESNWAHSSRAIAVTLTTFDCNTGQIFDADILLNGAQFRFSTGGQVGRADVQNTVTHEIGHFLGFDHSPDPESTMYADAPLGETKKRDLSADDVQGLCDVYRVGNEPRDGGCSAGPGSASSGATGALAAAVGLAALLVVRRRRAG